MSFDFQIHKIDFIILSTSNHFIVISSNKKRKQFIDFFHWHGMMKKIPFDSLENIFFIARLQMKKFFVQSIKKKFKII
jgi:hypothetical protein